MRQKSIVHILSLAITLLSLPFLHAATAPQCAQRDRSVKVMTRNLDAGSDFGYVLQAASNPDPTQLLLAITYTFQEMVNSNIPQRAKLIANEIHFAQPDLIGLQEITTLRTGTYGHPADTVVVDGLQSLRQELAARGLHYKAIAVQTNAVVDLPALDSSGNLITVGFTDYDAILARTDLPVSDFKLSNIAMQHFTAVLSFTVAEQSIPFLRGWISVDVKDRGKQYRFVTTHMETFSPDIQAMQTEELLAGPLMADIPVILAGDLNSDANQPSWANGPAFGILQAAGARDVWSHLRNIPGLTWPLFAEDPPRPANLLQRIDLVLTLGKGLRDAKIARTGVLPTTTGAWGSDHTGVVAKFVVLP